MKNLIKYISIGVFLTSIVACEMLEPIDENRVTIDYVGSDPASAEGLLLQGYKGLIDQYSFSEAATDDAVHNQLSNGYKRIATGELSSQYLGGVNRWDKYKEVFYLNKFLGIVEAGTAMWSRNKRVNKLFEDRLKGEALGLRGLYHFYVLQGHAGKIESGELMGIPYFKEFLESDANFNTPRLTFQATVDAIMDDFDTAIELLPTIYTKDPALIDNKYADYPVDTFSIVNGPQNELRLDGRIVKALKARVALFAASPSFLNSEDYYKMAAKNASDVLSLIGGVSGLANDGVEFYANSTPQNSNEMLWRSSVGGDSYTYERQNYPPSAFGNGNINPTHNLVSAFPMLNGLPATVENGYDPQNPYEGRDPRLKKYIVVNNETIGKSLINTGSDDEVDGVDAIPEKSTRTGYYLRKLMHPDVSFTSSSEVGKPHYDVYFRYTELFLIFAEAANEIGGPDYQENGISARDIIAAIRQRAGITQPDAYLATITTKENMRELIRNERRLELCFEGHRFWDLRRWGLSLTEEAIGYYLKDESYVEIPVEIRSYPNYATYLPIPDKEVLKFSNLQQNLGW